MDSDSALMNISVSDILTYLIKSNKILLQQFKSRNWHRLKPRPAFVVGFFYMLSTGDRIDFLLGALDINRKMNAASPCSIGFAVFPQN